MSREAALTPRSCPLCHGAGDSTGCRLCSGTGLVDEATAARWRTGGRSTGTSTSVKVADLVAGHLEQLRARGDVVSRALAVEGQAILDAIAAWKDRPAHPNDRLHVYQPVGPWQRRVLEHLSTPPTRTP